MRVGGSAANAARHASGYSSDGGAGGGGVFAADRAAAARDDVEKQITLSMDVAAVRGEIEMSKRVVGERSPKKLEG